MIATYPLRRDLWQELFDRLTDTDVEDFNQACGITDGVPYSKEAIAYMIPTITRIDDMLSGYYAEEIAFSTRFLKVTWKEEYVIVQVELTYRPIVNGN